MKTRKTLKAMIQHALDSYGFKERYYYDKTESDIILEKVREWVIHQPDRAMYFNEDGYTVSLISKRTLLDEIQPNVNQKESAQNSG